MINGVISVTAYSSGHSIGSCNWLLDIGSSKAYIYLITVKAYLFQLGYVATSSVRTTHMRQLDFTAFHNLDFLVLTSITLLPDADPYKNSTSISDTIADALNKGGNVLFPVNPVGYTFDLLEIIFGSLDQVSTPSKQSIRLLFSTEFPVTFLSILFRQ